MDPEAPRELGHLEDIEHVRRGPAPKKSLEEFLAEFEAHLRDNPGQAATSATAALEGRAGGDWRTPVEGAERLNRRLPRRAPPPRAAGPTPASIEQAGPLDFSVVEAPVGETPPVDQAGSEAVVAEVPVIEPTIGEPLTVEVVSAEEPAAVPAAAPTPASKRRNRHRRHHRHR